MQKYCIEKGKSSLVRDREQPFKSAYSSLINKETSKLFPYSSLHHVIHHSSQWPVTQPPQCKSGWCPRATRNIHKMSWCCETPSAADGWLMSTPPLWKTSSSPLPTAHSSTVSTRGNCIGSSHPDSPRGHTRPTLSSSLTKDQPHSHSHPVLRLSAAHFGAPSPRCSFLCFLSKLLQGRGFWQVPNSPLRLHHLHFRPQK